MNNIGQIIWFTGLSGSGKTTLAKEIKRFKNDVVILDGDDIRNVFKDNKFDEQSRNEHIVRTGKIAVLLAKQGFIVMCCLISPFKESRDEIKSIARLHSIDFRLVYIDCPLQTCIDRDVKGLYKKNTALMTGVKQKYDIPRYYDLKLNTDNDSVFECAMKLMNLIVR